jgi:hypothetical protein
MWIRMLVYPGGAAIRSLEVLPVSVDVQVLRVTRALGVGTFSGPEAQVRHAVQSTWRSDVERHGAEAPPGLENTCAGLDPALWFYAKWGCSFCERAGVKIPIGEPCSSCTVADS